VYLRRRSAYGSVYKVIHRSTQAPFAAKILNLIQPDNDTKTIENEIEILKKCSNANIVSYYGCCVTKDNKIWILMDYCALGSVRNVMEVVGRTYTCVAGYPSY
jgi:serine/threonine protein kinase